MYRRLIYLALGAVLLSAGLAHADLVHHWKLDEDTTAGATNVADSAGGNDGTINGAVSVEGVHGNAFYFDGAATIEVANFSTANIKTMTLAFWMNPDVGYTVTGGWKRVLSANDGWEAILNDGTGLIGNNLYRTGSVYAISTAPPPEGEWTHVAMTADLAPPGTGRQEVYVNGTLDGEMDDQAINDWAGGTFLMGYRASGGGEYYEGKLDDVRIYDTVLGEEEVQQAMLAGDPTLAADPDPIDTATDVPRDAILSWTPGDFAATHDVYVGATFEDVNGASRSNSLDVLASQGQTADTYETGRLEFDQTYYWRIDEVNAAPDNTLFKGEIWSFTVESFAYPITNVTATASHADATAGPENTINGSGLNNEDQHSIDAPDMWLAAPAAGEPVWIQYEFDGIYKLHEMQVWNYNVAFELVLGFGLKDVTVEYSTDGADWMTLGEVQFAQATATSTYTANTTVDLAGVAARFVRLNVNSGWGMMGQFGLSEVRFLSIPVLAHGSQPASGVEDVAPDVMLHWRAGREAASHDVYFSADEEAIASSTAPVETVAQSSYDTGVLDLELATTYYWRIDEVNEAETVSVWTGPVWDFSTTAYQVVEDFESYDDDDNTIFDTWIDGWVNETGSTVGYLEAPFAEQAIVYGGRQSMPLFYDNTSTANSESERTFDTSQDWTRSGIATLVIHFQGSADNAGGQLYAKVNGVKVVYDGDAGDIAAAAWTAWTIDLASLGTNLANVTSLAIGVEGGGSGIIYVDDIRLLP
jgi:concanavalin A-like lectin/glucanase superfamily protein/F5/8 type C domain-containing protein